MHWQRQGQSAVRVRLQGVGDYPGHQAQRRSVCAARQSAARQPLQDGRRTVWISGQVRQDDAKASAAASSARLSTCRRRSMLIWPNTMPTPNPSSGLNPPKPSWPYSTAVLYHLFESVH
jgi:hypothetical protein